MYRALYYAYIASQWAYYAFGVKAYTCHVAAYLQSYFMRSCQYNVTIKAECVI